MENRIRKLVEKRNARIIINKAGGNASKNSMKYTVNIPTVWAYNLNVEYWDRDIELIYDVAEKEIIIKKVKKTQEEREKAFLEYKEKKKNQS